MKFNVVFLVISEEIETTCKVKNSLQWTQMSLKIVSIQVFIITSILLEVILKNRQKSTIKFQNGVWSEMEDPQQNKNSMSILKHKERDYVPWVLNLAIFSFF